jgi:hypothetical protein
MVQVSLVDTWIELKVRSDPMTEAVNPTLISKERGRRSFRPRRPSSIWGWLLWLLVAVLFYLCISYGVVNWWQKPIPTDVPPVPSNSKPA